MPKITFVYSNGKEKTVDADVGLSVLEVAKDNDVPIEGACGGGLVCSTCHVIVSDEQRYEQLGIVSEEEEDMLDLAFGLEKTSRLCCQIIVSKKHEGLKLRVPGVTRNIL